MADATNTAKRARACDNCHSIKIKCELGTSGGKGPCARCIRLGKHCVVTPPKRQKDRVAELEAQVEALTKLLEAQNIQVPSDRSGPLDKEDSHGESTAAAAQSSLPQKKRRLIDDSITAESAVSNDVRFPLDGLISKQQQQALLQRYIDEYLPALPLVPVVGDSSLSAMRADRPLLLQAIIYATCSCVLELELQEEIAKVILDNLASAAIADGTKSLDLLQAIQITTLWFRSPKYHTHVSSFELIQIAAGMAEELGVGGPFCSASTFSYNNRAIGIDNEVAWRTWNICKLLSTSLCIFHRQSTIVEWSKYDDMSLMMLDYWQEAIAGTRLVCFITKAERLCQRIVAESSHLEIGVADTFTEPASQAARLSLQTAVLDFKTMPGPDANSPITVFWQHVTNMFLYESVLYTATNMPSFNAPYLPDRLSVSDFPMPLVADDHITYLHGLRDAIHGLLDVFLGLDLSIAMVLPALLFHAKVAQAQLVLLKLCIATTAVGNTYGAFVDPESLKVDEYLQRLVDMCRTVNDIDPRCGAGRILSASPRMKEWYLNYKSTFVNQDHASDVPLSAMSSEEQQAASYWTFPGDVDFGLEGLFQDPSASFPAYTQATYAGFKPLPS